MAVKLRDNGAGRYAGRRICLVEAPGRHMVAAADAHSAQPRVR
jgi:hypothetical protein